MILQMHQNGAVASVPQQLDNKVIRAGGVVTDYEPVQSGGSKRGLDHNENPAETLFQQHATLNEFDRDDTFRSMVSRNGEVRISNRNATVSTLSEELHHPKDPTMKTNFAKERNVPNYLNRAQMAQVQRQLPEAMQQGQQLRRYYDVAVMSRAAGQSFRYEE